MVAVSPEVACGPVYAMPPPLLTLTEPAVAVRPRLSANSGSPSKSRQSPTTGMLRLPPEATVRLGGW